MSAVSATSTDSLTIQQISAELCRHPQTIRRWIKRGVEGRKLMAREVGGIYEISRSDLDAFLHPPADPEEASYETLREYARRVAATAPPVSEEQIREIRSILMP